jgi:RNA polymerase sigma-70 factor (ECF subfamily)
VSVTGNVAAVEAPLEAGSLDVPVATLHATLLRDYPGLVAVLVRRLGDRQLALDALQDAVVTTLHKLSSGTTVPPEALAGYVFRTALNHQRNRQRRTRAWAYSSDALDACIDETASPASAAQSDATRRLVRRVLAGLDCARDRDVLVRFYLHEQDKEQICEALGLSSAQFNQVIFRARERMRRRFESIGLAAWDLVLLLVALRLCVPVG